MKWPDFTMRADVAAVFDFHLPDSLCCARICFSTIRNIASIRPFCFFLMPRFYCPGATFVLHEKCVLPEKARHHAGRVLRMKAGETATLFDGKGMEASGPIAFEGKDGFIVVESLTQSTVESPVRMRLVQALVSPEKTDWIIEKAVETGISEIILVPAARSVTKLTAERAAKRLAKCVDIAAGAAEQCGRAVVPSISFMPLAQALELEDEARFILAPGAASAPKLSGLTSCTFAVGPEGGFDDAEIALACEKGWQCALIGPRVLRTETAAIVFASLVGAASGDLRIV